MIFNKNKYLPLRQKLLPDGSTLANLKTRMSAGGVNVLFAMARGEPYNDFVIPIQRQSRTVSDCQTMISVIPKALHQAMIDPLAEVKLSSTAYRELYDEHFGGIEIQRGARRLRHDWFFEESEPVKWFRYHQGAYKLECICFGLNLPMGNYEFGILLLVRYTSYWEAFSHLLLTNWEGC
ncbi:hypothetical protein MYX76_05830 [Desulfobacterota bacterium AH_259_B03_O07]|nr:hypothetical protein [Desulfobacterota bacterium AH_259_B03_O07]